MRTEGYCKCCRTRGESEVLHPLFTVRRSCRRSWPSTFRRLRFAKFSHPQYSFLSKKVAFPRKTTAATVSSTFGQRTFDSAEHSRLLPGFQNSMMLTTKPAVPYTNSERGARMARPVYRLCCATLHQWKCRIPLGLAKKWPLVTKLVSHDRSTSCHDARKLGMMLKEFR